MKDIAQRVEIGDDAFIQYVIDGIDKKGVNKTILYGTKIMSQFKEKLNSYHIMIEEENQVEKSSHKEDSEYEKKELRCFNCGENGLASNKCQDKDKTRNCYKCKQFPKIVSKLTKVVN